MNLLAHRLAAAALTLTFTLGAIAPAFAATTTPRTIGYAGTLVSQSGTPLTTAHTFRFSLWRSGDLGASDLTNGAINTSAANFGGFVETQTLTPNPKGAFFAEIGAITPLPRLRLPEHTYLQVEVKAANEADSAYTLLDPDEDIASPIDRKPLTASPFALNAGTLDDAEIGTSEGNLAVLGKDGKWTGAQIPGGTNENTFRLDADTSGGDTQVSFGADKSIRFDVVNEKFIVNGTTVIEGNLGVRSDLFVDGKVNGRDLAADGATLTAAVAAVEAIKTTLTEKQTTIDALAASLSQAASATDVTAVSEKIAALTTEKNALAAELQTAVTRLAAVETNLDTTKSAIETLATRVEKTETQSSTTVTKLATLEAALVATNATLAEATKNLDESKNDNGKHKGDIEKAQRDIESLTASKRDIEASIAATETKRATLERVSATLTNELAVLKTDFATRIGSLEKLAHTANTDTGTTSTTWTLNSGNTASDVTMSFGATLGKYLKYSKDKQRFELNDGLAIDDNLAVTGSVFVDGSVNGRNITADGAKLDTLASDLATIKSVATAAKAAANTLLTWDFIPKADEKRIKEGDIGRQTGYVMTRAGRVVAVGVSGNPKDKSANGTFYITKNDDGAYDTPSVMTTLRLDKSGTGDENNSAFTTTPVAGVAGLTFKAGDVLRIYHSDRDQWGSRATIEMQYE